MCSVVEKDPHQPLCHHSVGESEPFISRFWNGQVTHSFQSRLSGCIFCSGEEKSPWKRKIALSTFHVMKRGDGVTPTKVKVINLTGALWKHIKIQNNPCPSFPNIPHSFEHLHIYLLVVVFFFKFVLMHFNRSITYKYPNIPRDTSLTGTKNNKPRKAGIEGAVCSLWYAAFNCHIN